MNVHQNPVKIGFIDYNTNRKNNLLVLKKNKDLNLYYLHLLCWVNFFYKMISPMLDDNNTWKLRLEYIVSQAIWTGLQKIERHYEQTTMPDLMQIDRLKKIVKDGEQYFHNEIRKCMMHYHFYDSSMVYISKDIFNKDLLFFGLFETYQYASCIDYYIQLRKYMRTVADYLSCFVKYDKNAIKYL